MFRYRAMECFKETRVHCKTAHHCKLIYTESEDGGGSLFFKNNDIPDKDLVPVNWTPKICETISKATGLKTRCDDIFSIVKRYGGAKSRHVVWIDLMQNSVTLDALRAVTDVATIAHITLSCHAEQPFTVLQRLERQCHEVGLRIEFSCKYRGRDGRHFMVHVVASNPDRRV